jgi:hypothetical protein
MHVLHACPILRVSTTTTTTTPATASATTTTTRTRKTTTGEYFLQCLEVVYIYYSATELGLSPFEQQHVAHIE